MVIDHFTSSGGFIFFNGSNIGLLRWTPTDGPSIIGFAADSGYKQGSR